MAWIDYVPAHILQIVLKSLSQELLSVCCSKHGKGSWGPRIEAHGSGTNLDRRIVYTDLFAKNRPSLNASSPSLGSQEIVDKLACQICRIAAA